MATPIELLAVAARKPAYDGTDNAAKYGAAVDVSAYNTMRLDMPRKSDAMSQEPILESIWLETSRSDSGPWSHLVELEKRDTTIANQPRQMVTGFDSYVRVGYVLRGRNVTKAASPNEVPPHTKTFGVTGEGV